MLFQSKTLNAMVQKDLIILILLLWIVFKSLLSYKILGLSSISSISIPVTYFTFVRL